MENKNFCKELFLFFIFIFFYSFTLFSNENNVSNNNFVILESVRTHELNPQITSYAADSQLLSGLYEGLFTYNPKTLEPEYAVAIDFRISRDKKRWTFTINPNAFFSNGEKITAENVRDSWLQLLATPEAPYSSLLDVILNAKEYRYGECTAEDVGIYTSGDSTLTIHLVKPANYLPRVLCHTAFSVIHRSPTVYSGAFYLDDCDGSTYILKKNPYYWDKENTHFEQITFLQSDDDVENAYYFNVGLVDWVTANIKTEKILDTKAMYLDAEFATNYLFFKHSSRRPSYVKAGYSSVWDFEEFRNALFEAMPWDSLRANTYVPATTLVFPLNGYPAVEGYSYTDSSEAVNLMKEARKKYQISDDEILPLVLDISEKSFPEEKLEALKKAFEPLGVELQIRTYPAAYYISSIANSDADLFCYVWIGDFADPLAFLELFRSESSLNDSGWNNKEYDELLELAAECVETERMKLLSQAESLLLDNYMVIPIQHPVSFNVINLNEIEGWYSNAFDIHPLKYLNKKTVSCDLPNVVLNKQGAVEQKVVY